MGSQTNNGGGGGGGFRAKMEHYLYSGEKKHVMAGMAIITVIFGVPWYLMNRGLVIGLKSLMKTLWYKASIPSRLFGESR